LPRPRFAVADTCFVIDWARFSKRDLLFELFDAVFVPESVLSEVKSERTVEFLASALASGRAALYTETPDEVEEARKLVEETRRLRLPPIDLPEALCLAVGRRRGYVVLTENRGALAAAELLEPYKGVVVWRALELLAAAVLEGVAGLGPGAARELFEAYERETLHFFPRRDLERALKAIEGRALGRGSP